MSGSRPAEAAPQLSPPQAAGVAGQGEGAQEALTRFWPYGWWRIMDAKIGIIPLPVYVVLIARDRGLDAHRQGAVRHPDGASSLLSVGGFTCAEIGNRIPIIRNIGAAAIFATFIPSALAYYHLLPQPILKVDDGLHEVQQLPLPVHRVDHRRQHPRHGPPCADRGLPQDLRPARRRLGRRGGGRARSVGTLLGLGAYHTFFFIVVPIMAGGVGEGAIPLSIGYSAILGQPQGDLFAQVLPPVMLGSLTAIVFAGHAELRRQALSASDRRGTPAAGRARRRGRDPEDDAAGPLRT